MAQPQTQHFTGGRVVVVAMIGESKILLIQETTKPLPHYWKLLSETVEPGESLLNAVVGAIREEAGWDSKNGIDLLKVEYGPDGKVTKVTDPRIKRIVQFGEEEWIKSRFPHWRFFYGVSTTDEVIRKLSGLHLEVDETEYIDTKAFPLAALDTVEGLMRQHAELIHSIPYRLKVDIGA